MLEEKIREDLKNTNLEEIGNQNENSEKENKLLNNDEMESQKNSNIAENKNKKDYREKLKKYLWFKKIQNSRSN